VEAVTLLAKPTYADLLAKAAPAVIRNEKENARYTAMLEELSGRHGDLTPNERKLADLLALLIEDFEAKNYRLPRASPLEAIVFLMDQHGLKQKDMLDIFGTPSIVSEVLSGKRAIHKEHISRLSERFHVSPELFF
jgi:HTH-type transcriptional regulator/antitoxin HigA